MDILRVICLVSAAMLLLALAPWPYGYYQFLRVAIFAAGLYTAISLWQDEQSLAVATMICALVFNPFLPVHLNREIWSVLNVAAAGVFGFAAYRARRT